MKRQTRANPGGRGPRRDGGLTMVELMIVMVILVVALLGFVFGLGVSVQDVGASRLSYIAMSAARSKVEELKGYTFRQIYADFGPGSAGQAFDVTYVEEGNTYRLETSRGSTSGLVLFCVDETAIPGDYGWVASYDLNGDGDSSDSDVSGRYKILPVIVRVTWMDAYGERDVEMKSILFDPKYPG
ncbi:MAG: prepilin-type N-terminal cleavage/methylation domain-containing protein [Planctomycetota bacterium]|nr:prepilin-type N-terminal cleavage/methylation domain-containing protein [Planctomycetota bacterium]